jgi:hypothetical protein
MILERNLESMAESLDSWLPSGAFVTPSGSFVRFRLVSLQLWRWTWLHASIATAAV